MHSCADAGSSMGREYDSSRVTGNWNEDERRGGWVGWAVRASTEMTVASRVMKRRAQPYEGENAFQRWCPSSCTTRFGGPTLFSATPQFGHQNFQDPDVLCPAPRAARRWCEWLADSDWRVRLKICSRLALFDTFLLLPPVS